MHALSRLSTGAEDGRAFAAMLVRGCAEERGMHSLVRNSVNRLARQIVTHTAKSDEYHRAGSRSEPSRPLPPFSNTFSFPCRWRRFGPESRVD